MPQNHDFVAPAFGHTGDKVVTHSPGGCAQQMKKRRRVGAAGARHKKSGLFRNQILGLKVVKEMSFDVHTREEIWRRTESNRRREAYEAPPLPTELLPRRKK